MNVIKLGDPPYVTSLHAVTYYVGEVRNKSTINLICIIYFIFYYIYFGLGGFEGAKVIYHIYVKIQTIFAA